MPSRRRPAARRRPARKAQQGVAAAVRAYLAAQPPATRRALQAVRAAIRAAAPRAVEHFSYQMPGFRLDGRPLVWYAGFKAHVSLFPMTSEIRRAHAAALKGYKTSTGTIQFPLDETMPVSLIEQLVRTRVRKIRSA